MNEKSLSNNNIEFKEDINDFINYETYKNRLVEDNIYTRKYSTEHKYNSIKKLINGTNNFRWNDFFL